MHKHTSIHIYTSLRLFFFLHSFRKGLKKCQIAVAT